MNLQSIKEVPSTQPDSDGVGRPLTHLDALKQVTGEAVYVDDIPAVKGKNKSQSITNKQLDF